MKLILWILTYTLFVSFLTGSPVPQRTGRLGHDIHLHGNEKTKPAQPHVHYSNNHQGHGAHTDHGHSHGHGVSHDHKSHGGPKAHSHGEQTPSKPKVDNTTARQTMKYEVPRNRHFNDATKHSHAHAHHDHTRGHAHAHTPGGGRSVKKVMNLNMGALSMDKNFFNKPPPSDVKYTKNTAKRIETTTPGPNRWRMKNSLQVGETRSFDTIFRETVSDRKYPFNTRGSTQTDSVTNSRSTSSTPSKLSIQKSIVRYEEHGGRSISKRGIGRLGGAQTRIPAQNKLDAGIIENTLTVKVWNKSKADNDLKLLSRAPFGRGRILKTTRQFMPVTTLPRFTQGRLGRKASTRSRPVTRFDTTAAPNLQPASTRIKYTVKASQTTEKPKMKSADMVKLQGIHVMFAQGEQQKNNNVPTLHLTAAIGDQGKGTPKPTPQTTKSPAEQKRLNMVNQLQQVIEKIVGTAVIKDGHLYLVVYPFGDQKSVDLRFPAGKTLKIDTATVTSPRPNRTLLPTNKPVPIPGMRSRATTRIPMVKTTTPQPRVYTPTAAMLMATTLSAASPMDMDMHDHHHHMHHMGEHMVAATKTTPNNKEDRDPLDPIPRFMSPWKDLNLSSIYPQPENSTSFDEEEKDVKVVPFVAQATDPFDQIEMILTMLANSTENVTSSQSGSADPPIDPTKEASFNFELKIQGDVTVTTSPTDTNKETTTVSDNTSEEKLKDITPSLDLSKFTATKQIKKETQTTNKMTTKKDTDPTTEYARGTVAPQTPKSVTSGMRTLDILNNMNLNTKQFSDYVTQSMGEAYNGDRPGTQGMIDAMKGSETNTVDNTQSVKHLHESENLYFSNPNTKRMYAVRRTTVSPTIQTSMPQLPELYAGITDSPVILQSVLPRIGELVTKKTETASMTESPGSVNQQQLQMKTMHAIPSTVQQTAATPMPQRVSAQDVIRQQDKTVGRTTFPTHNLDRGQTEQIISLADVLNDIRKIQLHNMQRFNIQNNNFNTMLLSNADMAPSLRSPVLNRQMFSGYPRIPTSQRVGFFSRPTTRAPSAVNAWQRNTNSRNAMRDALDAMLVLTVDDIVADHTNLHGALVLSQPRDASSGSSSSNNNK